LDAKVSKNSVRQRFILIHLQTKINELIAVLSSKSSTETEEHLHWQFSNKTKGDSKRIAFCLKISAKSAIAVF